MDFQKREDQLLEKIGELVHDRDKWKHEAERLEQELIIATEAALVTR